MTSAWLMGRKVRAYGRSIMSFGFLVAFVCAPIFAFQHEPASVHNLQPAVDGNEDVLASAQRRDRTLFEFQHTSWTVKDGAPSPIYDLAQSPDGYLWIATPAGLYRFDGRRFERFKPLQGQAFQSDNISSLMTTPDGGIWIGFAYGGADFLKEGHVTHYVQPEGISGGTVWSFASDHDGVAWAATNGGLARFDGSRWHRIGMDWDFPGKSAFAVFMDRGGTLWAATENTLLFLPRGQKHFFKAANLIGKTSSIAATPDGTLWVSVCCGDDPLLDLTTSPIPVASLQFPNALIGPRQIVKLRAVTAGLIDRAGSLWLTTDNGIFRSAHPERVRRDATSRFGGRAFEHFAQKDGLTADAGGGPLIEDRDGNIWMGTERGLDRFRETNVVPIAPLAEKAPLVSGNDGDVWAITRGTPHSKSNRMIHLRGMEAKTRPLAIAPTAASQGKGKVVWLAGPGRIIRYIDGQVTEIPYPKEADKLRDVQAIAEDRSGNLWISILGEGIFRRTEGTWSHFGKDLPNQTPVSITANPAGQVWLGFMGKNVALVEGGRVTDFKSSEGLQVENIEVINEHKGHVWIGGEHGLALFKDNNFTSIIADGDLAFDGVTGIVETAKGDLWLNAVSGICHISADEIVHAIQQPAHRVRYELFGVLDGLDGKALQLRPVPTLVESSDERLWFSTTSGIVQIDPNHLLRNTVPPSVFVSEIDAGGVKYSVSGETTLPPRTSSVHLEYTAPNLSVPERVQFRYRLEGSDKEWQNVGVRREAFYTNLGPGHYHFRVIASNNDGVWNTVGTEATFTIAPAWFQTVWFRTLCAAAFLLLLWLIYQLRLSQVEGQFNRTIEARVDERTRIARDLHDTLLQSFNALLLRFQAASNLLPARPNEAKQRVDSAIEQASEAITEGRDAVQELRSGGLTINLEQSVDNLGKQLLAGRAIEHPPTFRVQVNGNTKALNQNVRDEAYRIAGEALRNAIRHSGGQKIEVHIQYDERHFRLKIQDDGGGIRQDVLEGNLPAGHWGLRGMRERARLVGGTFELRSEFGFGTQVELSIPATSAYLKPHGSHGSVLSQIWRGFRD